MHSPSSLGGPHLLLEGLHTTDQDGKTHPSWARVSKQGSFTVGLGGSSGPPSPESRRLDLSGALLTTGFTDIHCHGGAGVAFESATSTRLLSQGLHPHRLRGTRRHLASLVSAPMHSTISRLRELSAHVANVPGLLGIHLEGPFLSHVQRGAHQPEALAEPTARNIAALIDAAQGTLSQMTIAPELPGALEAIEQLNAGNVAVAIGHTNATYEQCKEAFARGARLLTHTFNGMAGIHHRQPGPVLAAIDSPHVFLEVIADGVHVHPAALRLLFDVAPDRIVLVSDSMAAAGAPDGTYDLGGVAVRVTGGVARNPITEGLAGSVICLADAVTVCIESGISPTKVVRAATSNPLRALHLENVDPRNATTIDDLFIVAGNGEVRSVASVASAVFAHDPHGVSQ